MPTSCRMLSFCSKSTLRVSPLGEESLFATTWNDIDLLSIHSRDLQLALLRQFSKCHGNLGPNH